MFPSGCAFWARPISSVGLGTLWMATSGLSARGASPEGALTSPRFANKGFERLAGSGPGSVAGSQHSCFDGGVEWFGEGLPGGVIRLEHDVVAEPFVEIERR